MSPCMSTHIEHTSPPPIVAAPSQVSGFLLLGASAGHGGRGRAGGLVRVTGRRVGAGSRRHVSGQGRYTAAGSASAHGPAGAGDGAGGGRGGEGSPGGCHIRARTATGAVRQAGREHGGCV